MSFPVMPAHAGMTGREATGPGALYLFSLP
jgi:hypothetical protein